MKALKILLTCVALCGCLASCTTDPDDLGPAYVENLRIIEEGDGFIRIGWDLPDNYQTVDRWQIMRSYEGQKVRNEDEYIIGYVTKSTTEYVDYDVKIGYTYQYSVSAMRGHAIYGGRGYNDPMIYYTGGTYRYD